MRRVARRLFTLVSGLSLLLCVALCVVRVRSYWAEDGISTAASAAPPAATALAPAPPAGTTSAPAATAARSVAQKCGRRGSICVTEQR